MTRYIQDGSGKGRRERGGGEVFVVGSRGPLGGLMEENFLLGGSIYVNVTPGWLLLLLLLKILFIL